MKLLNLTDLNHLAHDLRQIIDRAVLAGSEVSYLQNAALILEEVAALSHPVVQPRLTTMDAPAHYTSVQSRAWAAGVIAAVPPGYVLVPIEPTQEMLEAGVKEQHGSATYKAVSRAGCKALEVEQCDNYAAMLRSAPKEQTE